MPDHVELVINGTSYSGWEAVSVRRSLDLFADSFDLTLTDTLAGQAKTIKLGSACQVKVAGEKLITGYVDRIHPSYDSKQRNLTVSGRSKTADLVDCSMPASMMSSQFNNRTLLQMAQAACKLFGITVSSTISLTAKRQVNYEPGTTLYEFLESQSRVDGVMLLSDPDGNVIISRASDEMVGTALVLGENIENAQGRFSNRDRFSDYYVDSQFNDSGVDDGAPLAHITASANDANMRFRPTALIANNDDANQAKVRAEWQRNVRYGRSRQARYTVSGWRHRDGLWMPNTRVLVMDDWIGFDNEWLMIGTVEYVLDEQGQRTRLTVMPAEAYDLVPLPAKDAGFFDD